jgi:periplasmic divalent cation tolerance protein
MAYCTFPNRETAENICRDLVVSGTIKCANILPAHTAIYLWQGQLHNDPEVSAIMKLSARQQAALKLRIKSLHPYSNPALVMWPIEDGLPEFLNWVNTP